MALLLSKTSTSLDSDKSVSLGVVNRLLAASQADPQTSSHQMSSRSSLPLPVEELHGLPCFLPVELIDFGLGLDTTAGEDWSRNRDSFVSELLSTGFFKGIGDVLVLMGEGVGRSFDWSTLSRFYARVFLPSKT